MQLLEDIKTAECRAFAEAWQRWRGAELVPRRSAVRIEEITKLLPLLSVLEVASPEVASIRLAGTALCEAMGVELTGLNYYDMTDPEDRVLRMARTRKLVELPCASHYMHVVVYKSGRSILTEGLAMPVWPNDASHPPQFFAVWMPLEETRFEGTVADPTTMKTAESFQFVDIGAGIPDPNLNLDNRPAATFLSGKTC